MSNSSDTESEAENVAQGWAAADYMQMSEAHLSHNVSQETSIPEHNVRQAIKMLGAIDICAIEYDTTSHEMLQHISSTLLCFLDEVLTSVSMTESNAAETLGTILQIPFITMLFEYRRMFHRIAARDLVDGGVIVVCWVDVVLAKLGDAIAAAAGSIPNGTSPTELCSDLLKKQRDEDALRAAVQMPEKWDTVVDVISSRHASPAGFRLALRLVFGVYVMGPRLRGIEPLREKVDDLRLLRVLQSRINSIFDPQTSTSVGNAIGHSEQERISYSMLVTLFASRDSIRGNHDHVPFRPQTQASLLRLVQIVMESNEMPSQPELIMPCPDLDIAQTILVKWGQTIPWCWVIWDDPRIANSETIDYLSVTWIAHLNSHESDSDLGEPIELWAEDMMDNLCINPTTAISAITRILHNNVASLLTTPPAHLSPAALSIVYRCCWGANYLLSVSSNAVDCIQGLYKIYFSLFVLLQDGDSEINIKDLIVEGLSFGSDALQVVVDHLLADAKLDFVLKLDEAISKYHRLISSNSGREDLQSRDLRAIRQILHFISLLWHCQTKTCLRRETISRFLNTLVSWLNLTPAGAINALMLRDALVTSLAILEMSKPSLCEVDKCWDDVTVWRMIGNSEPRDLVMSSAFAGYISFTSACKLFDPLAYAETWDFMRDVLLLVLLHQFTDVDEPLALVVAPTICQALSSLARYSTPSTAKYLISSPWTMNMCARLTDLIGASNDDAYETILRDRLSAFAKDLSHQLLGALHSNDDVSVEVPELRKTHLVHCRVNSLPCLVLS